VIKVGGGPSPRERAEIARQQKALEMFTAGRSVRDAAAYNGWTIAHTEHVIRLALARLAGLVNAQQEVLREVQIDERPIVESVVAPAGAGSSGELDAGGAGTGPGVDANGDGLIDGRSAPV
jgi:hypothetical protein